MIGLQLCTFCKHYQKGGTCQAFPDGIPPEALYENRHMEPLPGDHGIEFELERTLSPTLRATFDKAFGRAYRNRGRKVS
jgi:hypothetical protein